MGLCFIEILNIITIIRRGTIFFYHNLAKPISHILFLGAFVKSRKAIISCVMSVRLSVLMEKLGSLWTDFNEVWCLITFRKSVEKIQVSLKSDQNNGYFT
jgi:hypothetical protein